MSTIPEIISRGSLLNIPQFPGLLQLPFPQQPGASPQPQALQPPAQAPQQPQGNGGGIGAVLGHIFGGPDDPRLSPEQNQAARHQALLQAGLAILGSDSTGLKAIAQGGLYGQQAGAQARELTYGRTQQERIANALNDPSIKGLFTPQELAMIHVLGPQEAVAAIQKKLAEPNVQLAADAMLVTPQGKMLASNPKGQDNPAKIAEVMAGLGLPIGTKPEDLSPTGLKAYNARSAEMAKAGQATNTVILNEAKGIEADDLKRRAKFLDEGDAAGAQLGDLELMSKLLDQYPDLTSAPAQALLPVASMLGGLGVDVSSGKLESRQIFDKLSNKWMFTELHNLGGRILASQIPLMQKTVANLGNTVGANRAVVEIAKRVAEGKQETAQLADQFLADHKTMSGFEAFQREYAKAHPLFDDAFIQRIMQIAGPTKSGVPNSRPR